MSDIPSLPQVYRRMVGAQLRTQLEYRTSFVMETLSQIVVTFVDFAAIAVVFQQLPVLRGWALADVGLLYGLSGVAFGVCDMFVGSIERMPRRIRAGTFDVVLLRPLGALFQSLVEDFSLRRIGKVVQAGGVLTYALVAVDVAWDPVRIALVPVTILSGAVIFGCIFVMGAAATFWLIDVGESINALTYGGNFLTSYPLDVYGRWLRRLLGLGIGLGFVSYLPALHILGKPDALGLPAPLRFAAPVVAAGMVLLSRAVWRLAIRHYRSTGT